MPGAWRDDLVEGSERIGTSQLNDRVPVIRIIRLPLPDADGCSRLNVAPLGCREPLILIAEGDCIFLLACPLDSGEPNLQNTWRMVGVIASRACRGRIGHVIINRETVSGQTLYLVYEPHIRVEVKDVELLAASFVLRIRIS